MYRQIQSFGATLKFDPHFFVLNGIIETILMAFSMKTLRACTGMLPSENNDFKFLKPAKNIKKTCIMSTLVPGLVDRLTSPNQSVVDQKHERKSSHRAAVYIFQNMDI